MDWSKAKTYLIVAFLLLDILLGWQYYAAQQQEAGYVQSFSTQLQELRSLLAERRITLQADIPRETPGMRFLQVSSPSQPVPVIVQETQRRPQLVEDDKSKGTVVYRTADGDFQTTANGFFRVRYLPPVKLDGGGPAKASDKILQKIGNTVWRSSLYSEDLILSGDGLHRFYQHHQKRPVFSASLEVELQNSEIIGYNQKALEIGGEDDIERRVLSAVSAMRSMVETLDPKTFPAEGDVIRDIRLGYYSPNYDDADVWYLAPVWRIVTDRTVYYVNAFTGSVENGDTQ